MDEPDRMDPLDRLLSSERFLEPSSDFTRRVLEKVQREANAPPPIPFPWRRVAAAAALIAFASTLAGAMPAVRAPARRALDTLGGIDWPIAGVPIGTLGLALAIVVGTLWSAWRAR